MNKKADMETKEKMKDTIISGPSGGLPEIPWTKSPEEILKELDVSREEGLTPREVARRKKRYGPNILTQATSQSAWVILLHQFKNLIIGLLVVASGLSFAFGDWLEGLAIIAVIVINAAIGFFTELRAVRSMEALKRLGTVSARVRRQGHVIEVPASGLVPGDIVILEAGDIVTADLRVIKASKLNADESTLTGESVPVGKDINAIKGGKDQRIPLAERKNTLFKGTSIPRGSAEGVVIATGMDTELGRISSLVEEAEKEATPLEKRLDKLGHKLIWVTIFIAGIIVTTGVMSGKGLIDMVETAIALSVAAIPEGLPIVATIALARGMWRMARRNALINRLSAVETLGATTVICTDKTGTLTENRMTVVSYVLGDGLSPPRAER